MGFPQTLPAAKLIVFNLQLDVEESIKFWYRERKNYHYDDLSCDPNKMCGHYTQVMVTNAYTRKYIHIVGCFSSELPPYKYLLTHMYAYIYIFTYRETHTYMSIDRHLCVFVSVCVCVCVCIYVCVCMCAPM